MTHSLKFDPWFESAWLQPLSLPLEPKRFHGFTKVCFAFTFFLYRYASALVTKSVGDVLKQAIRDGAKPVVALDWSDSIASPDERVEWELWSTTNQVCGRVCNRVAGRVGYTFLISLQSETRFNLIKASTVRVSNQSSDTPARE